MMLGQCFSQGNLRTVISKERAVRFTAAATTENGLANSGNRKWQFQPGRVQ